MPHHSRLLTAALLLITALSVFGCASEEPQVEVLPGECARGLTVHVPLPFGTVNLDHEILIQVRHGDQSLGTVTVPIAAYEHVETIAYAMATTVRETLPAHAWIKPTIHPEFRSSAERPHQRLHGKDVWLEQGLCFGTVRIRLAAHEEPGPAQIHVIRLR